MENEKDVAKAVFEKCAQLYYGIIICAALYTVHKFNDLSLGNDSLNRLRENKTKLAGCYTSLEILHQQYIDISTQAKDQYEDVSALKSYYSLLKNYSPDSSEMNDVIKFTMYLDGIRRPDSIGSARSHHIELRVIDLKEFSKQVTNFNNFKNNINIDIATEGFTQADTVISTRAAEKIRTGMNPIEAIFEDLDIKIQGINPLNGDIEKDLTRQASEAYYDEQDFEKLTLNDLVKIIEGYSRNIDQQLTEKYNHKNTIPFIEIFVEDSRFNSVMLTLMMVISLFLIVSSTSLYKHRQANISLRDYNSVTKLSYLFVFRRPANMPMGNYWILWAWALLHLLIPILLLGIAQFHQDEHSYTLEIVFTLTFLILFYAWIFIIIRNSFKT